MSKPIDQELLPCPFCGGSARHVPADYVDAHGEPWPFAECESCNTGAPVEFWNKRASAQPAGGAVPEVTDAMRDAGSEAAVISMEHDSELGSSAWLDNPEEVLIAMLAAAPHPLSVPESMRAAAAAEMDRLGYGLHESHAESILIAAGVLHPVSGEQKAIQRKYPDWALVRQSDSAISIVQNSTYVTFREGEDDKRMPWLVEFLSSLLAGRDPVDPAAQDVAGLVEALEAARAHIGGQNVKVTPINVDGRSGYRFEDENLSTIRLLDKIDAALSAYRDQRGEQS